jgi:hypothetical protein
MTSTSSGKQTSQESSSKGDELEYEILSEEYNQYDLSFKIIVIGNSGNIKNIYILHYRRWEIMFINPSN